MYSTKQILITIQTTHTSLKKHTKIKSITFPIYIKKTLQTNTIKNI